MVCNVVVRDSIRDGYSKDGRVRDIAMVSKDISEAVVEVAWAQLRQTEALVLENDKLRKGIEGYQKVLANLELTADAASTTEPGTPNLYDQLQDKISSPEFLQQLTSAESLDPSVLRVGESDQEAGVWLFVADGSEERDGLGTSEGYVVITQQDIIDGVASFVARSISSLPQSKNMNPDQLQQAITSAFLDLQKTGKLRNCAQMLYAATSWGSTALGLYTNPVIRRAAWMAVYTSCSIILRLFP